ncbi:MAG: hybrid sensor histidine kinase/response regulator [bacterium]|nr:hybrid sensor histidine kinase/response regulator [bacterium]
MTKGHDAGDFSMLDLFRTELETHLATLNDGLLALERSPGDGDRLEALMRAAHSIKGGARIVEIEEIVRLAHVMEDCFVAAQQKKVSLSSQHIDVLLHGADMLNEISDAVIAGKQNWFAEYQAEFETLVRKLEQIVKPEAAVSSTEENAALQPFTVKNRNSKGGSSEIPPGPHLEKGGPGGILRGEAGKSPLLDVEPALVDFFRSEVEIHSLVIQSGLESFAETFENTDRADAMLQALRAIEGGAQIVGIEAASGFAKALERTFEAVRHGLLRLDERQLPTIQQGLEQLSTLAKAVAAGESERFTRSSETLKRLMTALELFHTEPSHRSEPVVTIDVSPQLSSGERNVERAADTSEKESESFSVAVPQRREGSAGSEPPELKKSSGKEKDRTVRVTATKIERLMGLAGEVVVSARWLPPFGDSLLNLKKTHRELASILEKMRERLRRQDADEELQELVLQAREKTKDAGGYLADRLNSFDRFAGTSATLSDRLYHEVIGIRMRPFSDGIRGFPRMVRDLGRELGKNVQLELVGKSTELDRDILEKLDAPLTHLLRNAIDHGIEYPEERVALGKAEVGTLRLEAIHRSGMLLITVSDDGRGLELDRLRQKIVRKGLANADMVGNLTEAELMKFLFLPGFSTSERVTEISGRGVGLDVVDNMVHEVGGVVRVNSHPGKGMIFYLELPLTLSVIRTFLVEIAGEPYAFPLARIERCVLLSKNDVNVVEDRQYFRFDDDNISLVDAHEILEIEKKKLPEDDKLPVVVIGDHANSYGLLVNRFVGEYDLVVRPLDPRLGKVQDISAVAVMLDGSPILIFDVEDLIRSVDKMLNKHKLKKLHNTEQSAGEVAVKRILVVDDSITVREMERKLLENKGYQVEVAVDGLAGWNIVRSEDFDLVVSDVDMPRMNGIEFVSHIKQHEALRSLPVMIVSYKDSEEHRLQGLEAGVDYYLTKSSFQDDSFINAVVDLIGEV